MSVTVEIENLRGRENYNIWSRRVREYLMSEGLWNTVRSTNSTNVENNLRAKIIIMCTVEDHLLESIDPDASPNTVWTSLQKQCK